MAKPKLLFLAHRIPYPPNKGDKIRSWNILKHLAESYDVYLGAFVDDPEDRRYEGDLRAVCAEVFLLDIERRALPQRLLSGWSAQKPLSVAMWEDEGMHRWVRSQLDRGGFEHVFIFSSQMAPYALKQATRRRMLMMDFVDVDSDKFTQYARESFWPKSMIYRREAELLKQFEKQVARVVDASLFVSEPEAALFKRHAGSYAHTVYALNNGVDLDYFSLDGDFTPRGALGTPSLVMTGAMDYKPNVDAALWMVKDILPRVREIFAEASFTIVGSSPTKEVKALGNKPGVFVTGRVPDVRPFVAAADIAVAPIRIARGVQNKVLEAMAMRRPVVSTTNAFSGIMATPGEELSIADDAASFADEIVRLMQDDAARTALAAAGRARMEADYSWSAQLSRLDDIIRKHKVELETA